jgi:hypothetical protein
MGIVLMLAVSVIGVGAYYCLATIQGIEADESIDRFMESTGRTSTDLMRAALDYTARNTPFIAEWGESIVKSASFECVGNRCELRELTIDVAIQRLYPCLGRHPNNVTLVSYSYDLEQNRVFTRRYAADAGNFISSTFLIDDILVPMEAALNSVIEGQFAVVEDSTMIGVVYRAYGDEWRVDIRDRSENVLYTTTVASH